MRLNLAKGRPESKFNAVIISIGGNLFGDALPTSVITASHQAYLVIIGQVIPISDLQNR